MLLLRLEACEAAAAVVTHLLDGNGKPGVVLELRDLGAEQVLVATRLTTLETNATTNSTSRGVNLTHIRVASIAGACTLAGIVLTALLKYALSPTPWPRVRMPMTFWEHAWEWVQWL